MSVQTLRTRSNTPPHVERIVRAVKGAAWMDAAACRTSTVDLWYDPETERAEARQERIDAARAICDGCPVRAECLETAIVNLEPYGIWGGLTTVQRSELIAARERTHAH